MKNVWLAGVAMLSGLSATGAWALPRSGAQLLSVDLPAESKARSPLVPFGIPDPGPARVVTSEGKEPAGENSFTLCGPGWPCSEPQLEIWQEFLRGESLPKNRIPAVFTGTCYHRTSYWDARRPEYAVAFLDERKGEHFYGGAFAFNYQTNPWTSLTVEEARQEFARMYERPARLVFKANYAEVDFNPGRSPMLIYWFRQEAGTGNLLLLGYFSAGKGETAFCRLARNGQRTASLPAPAGPVSTSAPRQEPEIAFAPPKGWPASQIEVARQLPDELYGQIASLTPMAGPQVRRAGVQCQSSPCTQKCGAIRREGDREECQLPYTECTMQCYDGAENWRCTTTCNRCLGWRMDSEGGRCSWWSDGCDTTCQ